MTDTASPLMVLDLQPYPAYKLSGLVWLPEIPAHWRTGRGKWLLKQMRRPIRDADEVVTCFRDGVVTLRKNRRTEGFTESLQEIGYQGIRAGDLVIHAMDAFAGAIGVADSDGKEHRSTRFADQSLTPMLISMPICFVRWPGVGGLPHSPLESGNAPRIFGIQHLLRSTYPSTPPRTTCHRPLPRPRGPADSAVH